MPRPKLPKSRRRTEVVFIKLLPAERRALERIHVARKRARPVELQLHSSRSAIMREAFVFWLEHGSRRRS